MRRRDGTTLERDDPVSSVAVTRRGGCGIGSGPQARLGKIRGVRVARGLAAHDTNTGATRSTRDELLDPAIVEPCARRGAILGEDLSEVTPALEGGVQRPFEDVLVDHGLARVRQCRCGPDSALPRAWS